MSLPALPSSLLVVLAAGLVPVLLSAAPDAGAARTVPLNVYAILSAPVEQHARAVAQDLGGAGLAAFPSRGHRVHCTLYLTEYPAERVPDALEQVRRLAAKGRAFPVHTAGLQETRSHWLFVNLQRTPALQQLSDDVVTALAPLRFPTPEVPGWLAGYPEKRASFDRYGSPNVGPHFEPHLTLLANADAARLGAWLTARGARFQAPVPGDVVGVGVAPADALGQVQEPLLEVMFPGRKR